jgi:hypothetical protein
LDPESAEQTAKGLHENKKAVKLNQRSAGANTAAGIFLFEGQGTASRASKNGTEKRPEGRTKTHGDANHKWGGPGG